MEQAKKRDHKVFITDVAIEKVNYIKVPGLTHDVCKRIHEEHKNLLRFSKNENNSNEVAAIYNCAKDGVIYIKGNANSVSFGTSIDYNRMCIDAFEKEIYVLHNHPNTSKFSIADIFQFVYEDLIGVLTVVTNMGDVHILYKTSNYDYNKTAEILNYLYLKFQRRTIDAETMINKFLRQCRQGGICYERSK